MASHIVLASIRARHGLEGVDLGAIKQQGRAVMESCPVRYVREAKLKGGLFEGGSGSGTTSWADTGFWVDHAEPLAALENTEQRAAAWPFGELPPGHEFLVIVQRRVSDV